MALFGHFNNLKIGADVIYQNDYYPFGMLLPNRHESSSEYKYGFNGMEKDDEISGEGNSYDFGARMYNPRIGRWMSVDAFTFEFPSESPYIFVGNSPLMFIDVGGNYKIVVTQAAKDANGGEVKITNFVKILDEIHAYLVENPQVVDEIHKQTGFSRERILNDSKTGQGPTIYITDDRKGAHAPEGGGIQMDYTLIQFFENYTGDELSEAVVNLISVAIVLHEYTHYGDRITNGGDITSDPIADPGDGKQKSKSRFGHRGTDTERRVLGTEVYVEGDAIYDDDGNRVGGKFIIPKTEIEKVKKRVTLFKKKDNTEPKKTVLPSDQN